MFSEFSSISQCAQFAPALFPALHVINFSINLFSVRPMESNWKRKKENKKNRKKHESTELIRCVNSIWNVRKQHSISVHLHFRYRIYMEYHSHSRKFDQNFIFLSGANTCLGWCWNRLYQLERREMETLSNIIKINGWRRQSLWMSKLFNRHRLCGAIATQSLPHVCTLVQCAHSHACTYGKYIQFLLHTEV